MKKYRQDVINYLVSLGIPGYEIRGETVVYVVYESQFITSFFFPEDKWNEQMEIDGVYVKDVEELYSILNKLPLIKRLLREKKLERLINE